MRQFLPLFPLQIVVFPGEDLNLHIFEPRYKELIKDCEEGGGTFRLCADPDDHPDTGEAFSERERGEETTRPSAFDEEGGGSDSKRRRDRKQQR